MRKIFLTLVFLLAGLLASAQISLPGTNLSFDFPSNGWKYLQTTNVDKNVTVYLYSYKASNVVDSVGDTVIPFMRIYVRKNYTGSVYDLAYSRFMTQPFQALDEYSEGLPAPGGLGYVGAYNDNSDGKDYMFRMIYFKDKNTIFEIRMETTLDTYPAMEEEFLSVLQTIKVN